MRASIESTPEAETTTATWLITLDESGIQRGSEREEKRERLLRELINFGNIDRFPNKPKSMFSIN